jgi:hypothetical protein
MAGMQGNSHSLSGYAPVSHLPPLKPPGGLALDANHTSSSSPAELECPVDQQQQQQQQQQPRHDWTDKSANNAWKYQSFQVL